MVNLKNGEAFKTSPPSKTVVFYTEIKMKPEYIPKFVTLNQLITKYLDLGENPIIFQINENIINQDYNEYLIDEKFILSIRTDKIKTSKINTEINLVKLTTKTIENIKLSEPIPN